MLCRTRTSPSLAPGPPVLPLVGKEAYTKWVAQLGSKGKPLARDL